MLDYLQLYPETLELISRYSKADRFDLIEALTMYACQGAAPSWPEDDLKWLIWAAVKIQVDRSIRKVEKNRANARSKQSETEPTEAKLSQPEPTRAKPISTNYELRTTNTTDDDDIKNAHACETPFGTIELDPVIILIQKELNGLTQSHYDDLEVFRRDLPDELVEEAVNEAVAHGVRSWAYVRSILQTYIRENVRSVGEARALKEKHKIDAKDNGGYKSTGWNYEQRKYTEDELASRCDDI